MYTYLRTLVKFVFVTLAEKINLINYANILQPDNITNDAVEHSARGPPQFRP